MEELLRGYINNADEQTCYYFENNVKNIANFIFSNTKPDSEVIVETIFGKQLLKTMDQGNNLTGKPTYVQKIDEYILALKSGDIKCDSVDFLDFSNFNGRDEFDSKEIDEKEFVRLYDGH
ncbi:MAG: hypothetical protein ACERKZ_02205 [Lachnotalea sp.]